MLLITGVSGLLGANLAQAARDRGLEVVGTYCQHPVSLQGASTIQLNLTDFLGGRDLCKTLRPKWVVHCAAATNVDWCEDNPAEARRLNSEVAENLTTACKAVDSRFVYVSTDSVFDGKRGGYDESDVPNPVNEYARSKLLGEQAVLAVAPASLVIRTNMYGWNAQPKASLAEWVLGRLRASQEVAGFMDIVFAPLLVNELCDVLLELLSNGASGLFHASSAGSCSKFDFARSIAQEFELEPSLVRPASHVTTLRAPRPRNTSLNSGKLAALLNRPLPGIRDGLHRMKMLEESGFVTCIRQMISPLPHSLG